MNFHFGSLELQLPPSMYATNYLTSCVLNVLPTYQPYSNYTDSAFVLGYSVLAYLNLTFNYDDTTVAIGLGDAAPSELVLKVNGGASIWILVGVCAAIALLGVGCGMMRRSKAKKEAAQAQSEPLAQQ
jgi:hypothetical protein